MRLVVQRVREASVSVDGNTISSIQKGSMLLVGIAKDDTHHDVSYMKEKILSLRIFPNEEGKPDKNIVDLQGSLLIVSQFTLYGDTRKGRRPDFFRAADFEDARNLYDLFVDECAKVVNTVSGSFGEHMHISLLNDGPYTILIDSKKEF